MQNREIHVFIGASILGAMDSRFSCSRAALTEAISSFLYFSDLRIHLQITSLRQFWTRG